MIDDNSLGRPRLAILVNIITPYRLPLYQRVASRFDTTVFYSGKETDRACWDGIESMSRGLRLHRSAGLSLVRKVGRRGQFDIRHLHLPFGHAVDLLKMKPDVVLSTEMGFRTVLALIYGAVFRRPVWVLWGGTTHTERRISLLRRFARPAFARVVRHWISYGASSTEYLHSLGVPSPRIVQMQNCIDETLYEPECEALIDMYPRPVLLHVGRLIGLKGIDLLIKAAAAVSERGHSFSLLIVGEGPERESLEGLATELNLSNVRFLPAQSPGDMPAVYRSADCLVFPTLGDVWGLVVNEALWSNIPVVASVFAGCAREILPSDQLFDPRDAEEFARTIERVIAGSPMPINRSPLRRCDEVATLITDSIMISLGRQQSQDKSAFKRNGEGDGSPLAVSH
jgi:glycosyltransferase involved in cell wall biosynthesis